MFFRFGWRSGTPPLVSAMLIAVFFSETDWTCVNGKGFRRILFGDSEDKTGLLSFEKCRSLPRLLEVEGDTCDMVSV